MSLSKKTESTRTKNALLTDLLKQANQLVDEFERLLSSELDLLKNGQIEGLEAIAEAKHELMDQIGAREGQLIKLFEDTTANSKVKHLKERLKKCRADNKDNHALVMLELKHSKKSLELLRSVLNMDDLSLYSENGEVEVNREKRKLGSA